MEPKSKLCKSCGRDIKISNGTTPYFPECQHCKEIFNLEKIISEYWRLHHKNVFDNPIHERNFKQVASIFPDVKEYELGKYRSEFKHKNRNKKVQNLIDRICYVKDYLLFNVGAQLEILDSIYDSHNTFWREMGNGWYYIQKACFQYVAINLEDIFFGTKDSKYSIRKIRNILVNNKNGFLKGHKVYEVYNFDESKDTFKQEFPTFPLDEYLNVMDQTIEHYQNTLQSVKAIRDNLYAHIGQILHPENLKNIGYYDLKQMFYLARVIYEGFISAVAPDKNSEVIVNHNMWFSHMNDITQYWIKNVREPRKKPKNN